jgi:hypothetical protein
MKRIYIILTIIFFGFSIVGCTMQNVDYIEFESAPQEMYKIGHKFDASTIKIKVFGSGFGSEGKILSLNSSGVDYYGLDFTTPGSKMINVRYKGASLSAKYYVVDEIINPGEISTSTFSSGITYGLKAGSYTVKTTIAVGGNNKNVNIIGSNGTIVKNDSSVTSLTLFDLYNGSINNIEITSTHELGTGADKNVSAIRIGNVYGVYGDVTIKETYIHNVRSGITVTAGYGSNTNYTLNIDSNLITDTRTAVFFNPNSLTQLSKVNVINNDIISNKTFGILLSADVKHSNGNPDPERIISDQPFAQYVNIKKNNISNNWYAQVESRFENLVFEVSQNYFGEGMSNTYVIPEDQIGDEPPHILEGGSPIIRPSSTRDRFIFGPTKYIENTNRTGTEYYENGAWIISAGFKPLKSYYEDPDCTRLITII